jgi:hypothetical protein
VEALLSEQEANFNTALREMKEIKDDIFKYSQLLFKFSLIQLVI